MPQYLLDKGTVFFKLTQFFDIDFIKIWFFYCNYCHLNVKTDDNFLLQIKFL